MKKLLKEVVEQIRPTEEEVKKEKELFRRIRKLIERDGFKCLLVGSLAKGTDLRGDKDVDIFITFPENLSREELEKKGLEIGKKVFKKLGIKTEIDYAEHPYVKGIYNNYTIEIVPCYRTNEPKSCVDRTPYHTEYIKKKLRRNKELRDEIRLLKQFMKGIGVYGAEAKVQGFSGYLTELLIVSYGSFQKTVGSASQWKFKEIIDPENLWKDKASLRYFFPDASLIVIDPVDENRNVAAAVSRQKLSEFIVNARKFLKNPDKSFFFPEEVRVPENEEIIRRINERGTKLMAIYFKHQRINPNILYSQLRKTIRSMVKSIEAFNFRVFKTGIWTDEDGLSVFLFEFEVWNLPGIKHHVGPSIYSSIEDQEKFLKIYRQDSPYIEENSWVVDTKREIRNVRTGMDRIVAEKKGFGKDMKEIDAFKIAEDKDVLDICKDEEFIKFLGKFLSIA
ncbi:MAG TPA: CCA tRNA nucleotidyltransferase [Candidatus Altiarchaeales archaeon]|nr:CCA tRNA nucleotidyltransferase [Candidatus Altiarchaeales archaeon]